VEALFVAVAGAAVAFAANQISPRGLVLTRNYFPAESNHTATAAANAGPAALSPAQLLAAQMRKNGLQLVDGSQAEKLFHDTRFKQNAVVFIDARDESHYREGHIPGAYEFDPYHPDKYFGAILPLCRAAEQIVVYCNGGDCDDSETAAILLRNVGIANQKLFVYGGGITEWTNNVLPVEVGSRNNRSQPGVNK
jgi:rhodanese-related sulfurtransferase